MSDSAGLVDFAIGLVSPVVKYILAQLAQMASCKTDFLYTLQAGGGEGGGGEGHHIEISSFVIS